MPLLIGALLGVIPVVLAVFAVAAVYWAAGMASGAAWFAWVETLVPQRLQARYFARRSLVSQWGVMAGFVLGGLVLHAAAGGGDALRAFALLFLVAAAGPLPLRRPAAAATRAHAPGQPAQPAAAVET